MFHMTWCHVCCFFKDTASTEIYTYVHTLSLHDALPIFDFARHERESGSDLTRDAFASPDCAARWNLGARRWERRRMMIAAVTTAPELDIARWFNSAPLSLAGLRGRVVVIGAFQIDRKSTRLNSSH